MVSIRSKRRIREALLGTLGADTGPAWVAIDKCQLSGHCGRRQRLVKRGNLPRPLLCYRARLSAPMNIHVHVVERPSLVFPVLAYVDTTGCWMR